MYVTGNGFLYNMVRVIMGTLLWVGEGKLVPSDIKRILEGRNRSLAGPTAMPHGLMLMDVEYDFEKQG
jgi:tRNA pseudouridine38-40 synthase